MHDLATLSRTKKIAVPLRTSISTRNAIKKRWSSTIFTTESSTSEHTGVQWLCECFETLHSEKVSTITEWINFRASVVFCHIQPLHTCKFPKFLRSSKPPHLSHQPSRSRISKHKFTTSVSAITTVAPGKRFLPFCFIIFKQGIYISLCLARNKYKTKLCSVLEKR